MTPEAVAPVANPFNRFLSEKGIKRVAIVDDAFDPLEGLEVRPDEAADFWALLEFDDSAKEELRRLGLEVADPAGLSPTVLAKVCDEKAKNPALRSIWERSVRGQRIAERLGQVVRLQENLKNLLGLDVLSFGSGEDKVTPEALKEVQIVFLDWYLGDDSADAIKTAVQRAKRIYSGWAAEHPKPLIVLMSSRPGVVAQADQFRRDTGLLAGIFYAFPKKELVDPFSLQLHMQVLARSMQFAHKLQEFMERLRAKVQEIGIEFAGRIGDLTLSDYAHIQRLSLQEDGQPFGDYLMSLFSAYFGHLLFNQALKPERDALDVVTFDDLVPFQSLPSLRLVEMYGYTLFDTEVGAVANHPRSSSAGPADRPTEPLLFLGDIFERTNTEAQDLYIIINAQCDLSFAPGAKRTMDPERSILLLPGRLQPLREAITDGEKDVPRTELFIRGEKTFRVLWNTRRLMSVKYKEIGTWLVDNQYQRTARLRLPYALELQRAFSADLNRVGMPVAPPIYQKLEPRFLRALDGKFEEWRIEEHERGVFTVLTREGERCVFTVPLVNALKRAVEERIATMTRELRELGEAKEGSSPKLKEQLGQRLEALERLRGDEREWMNLLEPLEIPKGNKVTKLLKDYLSLGLNIEVGAACGNNVVVAICIGAGED